MLGIVFNRFLSTEIVSFKFFLKNVTKPHQKHAFLTELDLSFYYVLYSYSIAFELR